MATADVVTTQLNYFIPPPEGIKPHVYINHSPKNNIPRENYEIKEIPFKVENLRGKEAQFNIDNSGFQFFKEPTNITNFDDDEYIKKHYYPEQVEVIKKLTGASRVVFFDHTLRRTYPEGVDDTPDTRRPVQRVHVDQTPESAEARVHRHLPAELVPSLLQKRFQIINLWRPINQPATELPLALCDWRSLDSSGLRNRELGIGDLVPTTLKYPTHDGETFNVKYNPNHKWNYLRGMGLDEGVLIKCFDSVDDGSVARLTPHTAFADPTTPDDAPKRESIELRALVFYD